MQYFIKLHNAFPSIIRVTYNYLMQLALNGSESMAMRVCKTSASMFLTEFSLNVTGVIVQDSAVRIVFIAMGGLVFGCP